MNPRWVRRALAVLVAGVLIGFPAGCSTTATNELTCSSNEIAPHTQPGAGDPEDALEWYLEHQEPERDRADYELSSESDTRRVYSDGRHQISVSVLPSDEDVEPVWVVLMTYDCT